MTDRHIMKNQDRLSLIVEHENVNFPSNSSQFFSSFLYSCLEIFIHVKKR